MKAKEITLIISWLNNLCAKYCDLFNRIFAGKTVHEHVLRSTDFGMEYCTEIDDTWFDDETIILFTAVMLVIGASIIIECLN